MDKINLCDYIEQEVIVTNAMIINFIYSMYQL